MRFLLCFCCFFGYIRAYGNNFCFYLLEFRLVDGKVCNLGIAHGTPTSPIKDKNNPLSLPGRKAYLFSFYVWQYKFWGLSIELKHDNTSSSFFPELC